MFLDALQQQYSADSDEIARRVVPITGRLGDSMLGKVWVVNLSFVFLTSWRTFQCAVGGGFVSRGMYEVDIVQLLKGAAAMNETFRTAADQNPVLQYVGAAHCLSRSERSIFVLRSGPSRSNQRDCGMTSCQHESLGEG